MGLKIAINTRLVLPGKLEGIGWFAFQTFWRLAQNHPEVQFYFIFDRKYNPQLTFTENIEPVVLFPPARHPALYYLFFEQAIPAYLNKLKPDLFVSSDGLLSLAYKGRQLPVFHDLNFIHNPENLPWISSKYFRWGFPKYAKIAQRIATVSEFSKTDIVKTLNYPAEKVDVVYNGTNQFFEPVSHQTALMVRQKYTGGCPYFVYVGSLHKRKNIENMLQAFDLFKATDNDNYKFIVVGKPMFGNGGINRLVDSLKHKDDVIFAGRLYNDKLNEVVASARALMLVSFFEGFGIPIIEAMNCDVPVITSNVASMPEVAGEAALLVDPHSVEAIAQAMRAIATDNDLHQSLINKGRITRQRYSWDLTAENMWNSIQKCL